MPLRRAARWAGDLPRRRAMRTRGMVGSPGPGWWMSAGLLLIFPAGWSDPPGLPLRAGGGVKRAARAFRHSIGELAEHRIDAAVPGTVEQFELAFGRSLVGLHDLDHRFEEDAFVCAVAVEAGAALEAVTGDLQCFLGQIAHRAVAERQFQRVLRHAVAQRVAFDRREVLDQV